MTFAQELYAKISAAGDRPFWVGTDRTYTYRDLEDCVHRACGVFDRADLKAEDVILIIVKDDWQAVTLFMAAVLDGKIPVVLSPDAGNDRVTSIRSKTDAALIVTDPERARDTWAARAALAGSPDAANAVVDVGLGQFVLAAAMTAEGRRPYCTSEADATAYLLFTSGTTVAPKGVVLSHGNLSHQLNDVARVLALGPDARLFNGLVVYHADGLIQGPVLCAYAGATLIRAPRFEVSEIDNWLDILRREKATHMLGVPTIYSLMDRFVEGNDRLSDHDLRMVISTAAPLQGALWQRLESRFGVPVVNEYGMTETVAATHFAGPFPEMGATGTIGRPVGCDAQIRDESGNPVSDNEMGRLWVRGGQIFRGYFKDKARTDAVMAAGWFDTGDMARCRGDGSYEICGRASTALNIGGFIVLPEEIDEALLLHAGVREAQTIGVDHPDFGTTAVSAVVLNCDISEDVLVQHCRASLETWKVPRRILAVPSIPRGGSGKAILQDLKELLTRSLDLAGGAEQSKEATVLDIAARVFGCDPASIQPDQNRDDVPGWDSYAHVTLALEIEEAFGVRLRPRQVLEIQTIADIQSLVAE